VALAETHDTVKAWPLSSHSVSGKSKQVHETAEDHGDSGCAKDGSFVERCQNELLLMAFMRQYHFRTFMAAANTSMESISGSPR
jgi:hypothetical protein